jgi:uncharacterized protein YbgA (DUF1722 family)/uncharacterized protein YbbK (DUF523 family)
MSDARRASRPIHIGISSCLLGQKVRFDGGHKRDTFLTETFGRFVEWVPVCPEVECGFGTPREAMRLVQAQHGLRLMTIKTGKDLTDVMQRYADRRIRELEHEDLCGYVLKKNSPSCGMERVKVYDVHGRPAPSGRGLFAATLLERCPGLPIEEEGRLSDPRLRDNFVERVFAYRRLRDLFVDGWEVGDLVRFHTAHKLAILAHSPRAYRELGQLVAQARKTARAEVESRYGETFMTALAVMATPGRQANVLQHMVGYFKEVLDAGSKAELLRTIDDYRRRLVPLIVPITLLRHHVRRHGIAYLAGQVYLDPHPKELMLRNHV